ncbi:MAG TPA: hypothetical protein VN747_08785 [Burkholderiales bacterium]|nr:hypothetical protein [Burkholderiales bacterium]
MSALARWLVAGALLGAGLAHAQDQAAGDKIDIAPPPSWEGGWTAAVNEGGPGWSRIEFRPATQTADSSRHAIQLLEIWGGRQRDGADRLLGKWDEDLRKACPQASAAQGAARNANGFSVRYVQFLCPQRSDTGQGMVHFLKTISSDKHTFLVAVLRASPSFTVTGTTVRYADNAEVEALDRWIKSTSTYLEKVHACDAHSQFVTVCSP